MDNDKDSNPDARDFTIVLSETQKFVNCNINMNSCNFKLI